MLSLEPFHVIDFTMVLRGFLTAKSGSKRDFFVVVLVELVLVIFRQGAFSFL